MLNSLKNYFLAEKVPEDTGGQIMLNSLKNYFLAEKVPEDTGMYMYQCLVI
jgi:hypothetical protein